MKRIFLLEDDPIVGKAIQLQLELDGFTVDWVKSLKDAKMSLGSHPSSDLFLLDVNLPDGSGYEFCQWLRENNFETPIIFLTARTDEESLVKGFDFGANDYIRKPFSKVELLARLKNQLSEKKPSLAILRFGGVSLIKNQQVLKSNDQIVSLNRREYEILMVLFENPEMILSREQLIVGLSSGEEIFDRTIDSHISHIRAKLQKNGIVEVKINSVYGQGYRLEKSP